MYASKYLTKGSQKKKKKSVFVFANLCVVAFPTMSDFKLPVLYTQVNLYPPHRSLFPYPSLFCSRKPLQFSHQCFSLTMTTLLLQISVPSTYLQ